MCTRQHLDPQYEQEFMQHVKRDASEDSLHSLKLDEGPKIGYTLKCMGSGFWGLCAPPDFKGMINLLIKEGGDADTCVALLSCCSFCSNLMICCGVLLQKWSRVRCHVGSTIWLFCSTTRLAGGHASQSVVGPQGGSLPQPHGHHSGPAAGH